MHERIPSYTRLSQAVRNLRLNDPHRPIWEMITSNPFSRESVDSMVSKGWKIWLIDLEGFESMGGGCWTELKCIILKHRLEGFERDVTLFHELLHAHYGDELTDRKTEGQKGEENFLIIEWIARQSRADPELLKYTINTFQLEPQIYDKVSCQAFAPDWQSLDNYISGRQKAFPFLRQFVDKEYLKSVKTVQFD